MRYAFALMATLLSLAWATPATAQMCGAAKTDGAAANAATGGMCGASNRATGADQTPEMQTPAQKSAQGGCSCCRDMAMMHGGMGGAQPPATPSAPQMTPDMPGMQDAPQTPRPQ